MAPMIRLPKTAYTANSFFGGRIPDEFEIIAYAEQLLDFLCFRYDLHGETMHKLMEKYHFFFSPSLSILDENGNWIISSLIGESRSLFAIGFNAPETYSGVFNEQTDIFAFGMFLYWVATQNNPAKPPYKTIKVRKVNPNISRSLVRLIEKCIAINPKKRYSSFRKIREKLYLMRR